MRKNIFLEVCYLGEKKMMYFTMTCNLCWVLSDSSSEVMRVKSACRRAVLCEARFASAVDSAARRLSLSDDVFNSSHCSLELHYLYFYLFKNMSSSRGSEGTQRSPSAL